MRSVAYAAVMSTMLLVPFQLSASAEHPFGHGGHAARRAPGLAEADSEQLVGTALAAEAIVVTTLPRDGQVLVSFELPGAYTDELRDTIESGLATTFTYEVELRDPTPFWLDRTIDRATISATVRFDSLTRQYTVTRIVNGQAEDRQIVGDEEAVRQLLTRFERLPLFNTAGLEANGEYHVRVRARTRPRIAWFFWPWDGAAASGAARFTFLP